MVDRDDDRRPVPVTVPSTYGSADKPSFLVKWDISHMTPETAAVHVRRAEADEKIAEFTHAAPARELTKQTYALELGAGVIGAAVLAIAATKLTGAPLAWVLVAVAGIFGIGAVTPKIIEAIEKKNGDA